MKRNSCLHSVLRFFALGGVGLMCLSVPVLAKTTIDISKPGVGSEFTGQQSLDVAVTVRDPRGLKSIELFLNGRPLEQPGLRNLRLRPLRNLQGVTEYPVAIRIPVRTLKENANKISLRVENMVGDFARDQRAFRYRKAKGTIYLVAIGINKYRQAKIPPLKYAENDARAVARYFREQVGVPADNIFTLLGKKATARNIKRLLGVTLQRKAGRDDQIMIFYAGHGVPEFDSSVDAPDLVEKYLLPWDGEVDALYATAIPMRDIDFLSKRYASERVVFMLDTCFSGAAAGARTVDFAMRGRRSVRLDDGFLNKVTSATGRVILTASGVNEASQELDGLRHGVFTYYLLDGLKGRADFDSNGVVSVTEVHKYLSEKVPPLTNQEQRPTYFMNSTVTGEIVLGRSPTADFKFDIRDPWTEARDFGRLIVQVSPRDANIFIDGFYRGSGFINTLLRPGRHRVRIEKPGYRSGERLVQIDKRSLSQEKFALKANLHRRVIKRAPPPP